jgi:hypothetical protein
VQLLLLFKYLFSFISPTHLHGHEKTFLVPFHVLAIKLNKI